MRGYIYLIFAALSLATIGIFVKAISSQFHFMTLIFYRVLIGFLFLLIVVPLIDKTTFKIKKKDIKGYMITGLLFAISLTLYQTAFYYTKIQNAVMINYSYPIFILIFAYFILKEKITKEKIITLALAIIGLAIINPINSSEGHLGNLLSFFGAISYALLIIMFRKEDKNHSIGSVVWFLFFATIFLSPFPFIYGFGPIQANISYLLALGIISTGIAYLFYNLGLEEIEAEISAVIITLITPIASILLAVIIINEEISTRIILGGVFLIMGGLYLNLHIKIRKYISKVSFIK